MLDSKGKNPRALSPRSFNKKDFLSIIYVYFNTPQEVVKSLNSLTDAVGKYTYEVIIVDNNSSKNLPSNVRKNKNIRIISNKDNKGYGAGLNTGIGLARGEYVLCTNTDTIYEKSSIAILVDTLKYDKKIGVIGPKMIGLAGETLETKSHYPLFPISVFIYSQLKKLPLFSNAWFWFHYRNKKNIKQVDVIGGASMLFRKRVHKLVGGFDEQFFLYFEEADICKKISKAGYKIVYCSSAEVVHAVGKSLSDKDKIKSYFEISRYRFIKKHQGFLTAVASEAMTRFFSFNTAAVLSLFILSLYLNLHKITTLMMFFGDFARDMLVARDMLLSNIIPLVGIPSSVAWLHQGPLSIYFIGLSFLFFGYEPWSPVIFYGLLGSVTGILVYVLGGQMYGRKVGVLSMLMFVTSPLVIINLRIPYHTAPIPFFTVLFYITLFYFLKQRKKYLLVCLGILLGLLFMLELSNAVLFLVIILMMLIYRIKLNTKDLILFIIGLFLGLLPFLFYDISHKFYQLGGFSLWAVNRTRLFFGLTLSDDATGAQAIGAIIIIWEQLVRFIFPASSVFVVVFVVAALVILPFHLPRLRKGKHYSSLILILGLVVPIAGFIIHAKPGTAYFPVLFPLLSIAVAVVTISFSKHLRYFVFVFLTICLLNAVYVVRNSYFLNINGQEGSKIGDWRYGLGIALFEQRKAIDFIKADSGGNMIRIRPGGFLQNFATGIDNYRYLAWIMGVKEHESGKEYTIYQSISEVPDDSRVVYRSRDIFIVSDE